MARQTEQLGLKIDLGDKEFVLALDRQVHAVAQVRTHGVDYALSGPSKANRQDMAARFPINKERLQR